MKNTINEMKTPLEGIKRRSEDAEQVSNLEGRVMESRQAKEQKEKRMKRNE